MYQPMLFIHWKQVRHVLIPFVVAAFSLPMLAVQGLGTDGSRAVSVEIYQIVSSSQLWLPLFPALAGGVGVVLALTAWNWDHKLGHVYALSLPVARWEYTLLKMSAGVVLGLLPAIALWLGAHLALATITLPTGLTAYPSQLALRFFLATLMAYSFFFALGAGTIRTTLWVVGGLLALFVGSALVGDLVAAYVPALSEMSGLDLATRWLVKVGGPLQVFTGNWSLIDV